MPRVPDNPNNRSVAAILLREGSVVAFPTDTVYGLGAIVFKPSAISSLFVMKGRERDQGFPVLIAAETQLREIAAEVSEEAMALAKRFWPGGLTLVLPRHPDLPLSVTGGHDTVAVRLPDHPTPQGLISACGSPITGTSANRHGGPEPTTADEVHRQLGSRLSMVLDGGPTPGPVPSTVLDVTSVPARILRAGVITADEIRTVCEVVEPAPAESVGEQAG